MPYKVGDRVRVRCDLKIGGYYRMSNNPDVHDGVVRDMLRFAGKVVTIAKIENFSGKYRIVECGWNWTDEMFDGLEDTDDDSAFDFNLDELFERG